MEANRWVSSTSGSGGSAGTLSAAHNAAPGRPATRTRSPMKSQLEPPSLLLFHMKSVPGSSDDPAPARSSATRLSREALSGPSGVAS